MNETGTISRKGTLLLVVLSVYFLALFFYTILGCRVMLQLGGNEWRIGDWLINYSGGFVRRGLPGEVFLRLQGIIGGSLLINVLLFQVGAFLIMLVLGLLLLREQENKGVFILLFFSPATFSFYSLNILSFRKEMLLILFFMLLSLALIKIPRHSKKILLTGCYIYPLLVLCHESLLFFLPYLGMLFCICLDDWKEAVKPALPALLVLAVVFILTVLYHGDTNTVRAIYESLTDKISVNSLMVRNTGAIPALANSFSNQFGAVKSTILKEQYLPKFSICFLLVCIAFVPFTHVTFKRMIRSSFFTVCAYAMAALTLFLMTFTEDWGRWFHINVMLGLCLLAVRMPEKFSGPALSGGLKLAFVLFVAVYSLSWRLTVWKGSIFSVLLSTF